MTPAELEQFLRVHLGGTPPAAGEEKLTHERFFLLVDAALNGKQG